MIKFDLVIYEGGDLAAALTEADTPAVFVYNVQESDALMLAKVLTCYGVDCCISTHKGD